MRTRLHFAVAAAALALALGLTDSARAQDDAALAKKRDEKLAQPWVKSGGWFTDYGKALAESRKTGKPVLAYFTLTSNPAPSCDRFEHALADAKFADVGKSFVLFLHITSGVKKDKNQDLPAKKGGKNSLPYAVWLDADGNVVMECDAWMYSEPARAIAGVDDSGKRAAWYLDVKKKVAGGGNPEKIDLLLADVELDKVKLADAEKRLANLGPSDEQKATFEGLKVRTEIKPTVEKLMNGANYDTLVAAGKDFLAIHKANRPAPPFIPELEFFWRCIVLHARKEKDAASLEEALKALKAKFGDSAGSSLYFHFGQETWKGYFEEQEKALADLKAKAGGK